MSTDRPAITPGRNRLGTLVVAMITALALMVGLSQFVAHPDAAHADCNLVLDSSGAQPGYYAVSYTYKVGFNSCFSPSINMTRGTLPPGLSWGSTVKDGSLANAWARYLTGVPTASGSYTFWVAGTDGFNTTPEQQVSITIYGNPSFTASSPPNVKINTPGYSYTFTSNNNGYVSGVAGNLPTGMSLSNGYGSATLSGTPTFADTYNFTMRTANPSSSQDVSVTMIVYALPVFTAQSPPGGYVGVDYSYFFVATGYPTPVFSVPTGSTLPPGLTLNSATGELSGRPTTLAGNSFTVRATNVGGFATSTTSNVTAATPVAPILNTPANINFPITNSWTPYQYTASGTPSPKFRVVSGYEQFLPPGLSVNALGQLVGQPTVAGPYSFYVEAYNGVAPTSGKSQTIYVGGVPTFTASAPPDGTYNTSYDYTFMASGDPVPGVSISLNSGSTLPAGLTIAAGRISGLPSGPGGQFTITVTASSWAGSTSITRTITINRTADLTQPAQVYGVVGQAISPYQYSATGYPAPTISLQSGLIPSGLSITTVNSVTQLVGTPLSPGFFNFNVQASNGIGGTSYYTQYVSIWQKPAFTASSPPDGKVGDPFSYKFVANGFPAPDLALTGTLPTGLSFDASTGTLSGTPLTSGQFAITVTAANYGGTTPVSKTITFVKTPVFTASAPPNATSGSSPPFYSYTFAADGYPTPTTFTVTAGSLPVGLALSSGGVLSGYPTTTGPKTFTVRARSTYLGTNYDTPVVVSMTVGLAPTFTAQSAPTTATAGNSFGPYTYMADGTPSGGVTYSFVGTVPNGMTFNSGVLGGIPLVAGPYSFQVSATNGFGTTNSTTQTLTVGIAPALTAASAPTTGQVNVQYSYFFVATGSGSITWSVASGTLPTGVTLDPSSGAVSGAPSSSGPYSFAVKATSVYGSVTSSTQTVTIAAAGIRTASIQSQQLTRVTASPSQQSRAGQLTLQVSDTTNTRVGWSVTVSSSAFGYQGAFGGSSIPASAFAVTSVGAATWVSGDAVVTGTDAVPKGPQSAAITNGVSGALDSARALFRAASGYGTGSYLFPVNVNLAVPAGAKAGLYTSTLTVTIATGP